MLITEFSEGLINPVFGGLEMEVSYVEESVERFGRGNEL